MSDNNEVQSVEVKETEHVSGPRGELGTSTPSLTIKQMWRAAHFKRTLAPTTQNKRHHTWVATSHAPSLKVFAKSLAAAGDETAKEWLANKGGVKNPKRSEINIKAAREAAFASKTARRKSGKK